MLLGKPAPARPSLEALCDGDWARAGMQVPMPGASHVYTRRQQWGGVSSVGPPVVLLV